MDNGACSYRRFLCGDDSGITEIVKEYKDGLILYLNGYVKNILIAEELAEDTFFRLITKRPRFLGKSSFKSWLYSIGRHIAVDYIRRNSKLLVCAPTDNELLFAEEQSVELSYIKQEQKFAIHKAMKSLPTDYKNVLWLSVFEGFSNKEICAVMKKSDRQVKNLLYRAKQALKSTLEKEGFLYEDL